MLKGSAELSLSAWRKTGWEDGCTRYISAAAFLNFPISNPAVLLITTPSENALHLERNRGLSRLRWFSETSERVTKDASIPCPSLRAPSNRNSEIGPKSPLRNEETLGGPVDQRQKHYVPYYIHSSIIRDMPRKRNRSAAISNKILYKFQQIVLRECYALMSDKLG